MLGNIFIVHIKPKTTILIAMVSFKVMHNTVTVWIDDGKQETQKALLGDAPTRSISIILSIVSN